MRDLKVKMKKLKRSQKPSVSNVLKRLEKNIKRCLWYNSRSYKCNECNNYKIAIKEGIIYFKEGRIWLLSTYELLRTNFKKRCIKKLVEVQANKNSFISKREAKSYAIEVG